MGRPLDTAADADRRQFEAFRAMTPGQRLRIADEMSSEVRRLAEAGFYRAHPGLREDERDDAVAELLLGPQLASAARQGRPDRSL